MFDEGIILNNHGVSLLTGGAPAPKKALDILSVAIRQIQQNLAAVNEHEHEPQSVSDCYDRAGPFSLEARPLSSKLCYEGNASRRTVYCKALKIVLDQKKAPSLNALDVNDFSMISSGAVMFNLALCNHLWGLRASRRSGNTHRSSGARKLAISSQLYKLVLKMLQSPLQQLLSKKNRSCYRSLSFDNTLLSLFLIVRNNLSCIQEVFRREHEGDLRLADSQTIQVMNLIDSSARSSSSNGVTSLLLSDEDWQRMTGNCLRSLLGHRYCHKVAPAA